MVSKDAQSLFFYVQGHVERLAAQAAQASLDE